jgi:hypothetical protein
VETRRGEDPGSLRNPTKDIPTQITHTRALDLDNIGTKITKHLSGSGAKLDLREIQNANAV